MRALLIRFNMSAVELATHPSYSRLNPDPDDEEVKLSNQRLGTRRNLLLIVTFAFFSTYVAVVSTYY